jgi:GNAT superfamily N-acetyltransferase
MNLSDFSFVKLDDNLPIASFDCGDDDLNDFLHHDALPYEKQLLAVTYAFLDKEKKIVAFFSVSNDSLIDKGYAGWNRLNRKIKNQKRRRDYPAVKIGRLGVSKDFAGHSLGTQMLDFVKGWFAIANKTGCRFALVDAYNRKEVLHFYEKNDFTFLTEKDENAKTRLMFFDLIKITEP